jgi:hypothetical protein
MVNFEQSSRTGRGNSVGEFYMQFAPVAQRPGGERSAAAIATASVRQSHWRTRLPVCPSWSGACSPNHMYRPYEFKTKTSYLRLVHLELNRYCDANLYCSPIVRGRHGRRFGPFDLFRKRVYSQPELLRDSSKTLEIVSNIEQNLPGSLGENNKVVRLCGKPAARCRLRYRD